MQGPELMDNFFIQAKIRRTLPRVLAGFVLFCGILVAQGEEGYNLEF
jgi:hypothetical protein